MTKILPIDLPKKDDVFLAIAMVIAQLSKDAETKCGCVITDSSFRVLSAGYNSFPAGFPDNEIPNIRPAKYPYIIHAESNALSFCQLRPSGGTAYITTYPCTECIKLLHQNEIARVVYINSVKHKKPQMLGDEDSIARANIIRWSGIEFIETEPDFSFLVGNVTNFIHAS